jgi:transposase
MDTRNCPPAPSDPASIPNPLGNSDDPAFCKPVQAALDEAGFDAWVESLCRPYYAASESRLPISLGTFFRLNLLACLKANGRQWTSRSQMPQASSPTEMLGAPKLPPSRDGTNLASAVCRLPLNIHRKVFAYAIGIIIGKGLVQRPVTNSRSAGEKRSPVLSSMVHKETGEDWTDAD